jgi:hypothetical protein
MMSVYKVCTMITAKAGNTVTKWDMVVANGCEVARENVRLSYAGKGVIIKRILSLESIGDVTIP